MRDVWLILRGCALRHWRLAWRQQLMLLLILALGTAVHVAMRLANRSALAGFERFTDTLTQDSDWTLRPDAGALRMDWLREMRARLGSLPVSLLPIIEATVVPDREQNEVSLGSRPTWRLVGMDLIALQNMRASFASGPSAIEISGSEVFVSAAMAQREGWRAGDKTKLVINDQIVSVTIGGVMPQLPDKPAPPDNLLLMDLAAAQTLLGRAGEADLVEVIAPEGTAFPGLRMEAKSRLSELAKGRWQVLDHEDRRALASGMTAAFRLNLTVLSLLALLVGGYLMFQALDGVVIRRREEIAILRSLGVTESSVRNAFLLEAALLGTVAGALGVLLGWAGAQGAVLGVARTMTALYGASTATFAPLETSEALLGIGLCVATSLVAAWWPARSAASTVPAVVLGRHAVPWQGGRLWRTEWLGLALAALALGLAQIGPMHFGSVRVPVAAYGSALGWLLGAGLLAGGCLRFLGHRGSAAASVAASHLRLPTVRHRFAVAALTSAVAMTSGMAVMIASFDHTMRDWIVRSMRADIYLASAGAQSASSTHQISASTVEAIRQIPEIAELATLQHSSVTLADGPLHVMGSQPEFTEKHDLYAWVEAPPVGWWESAEPVGLVNESLTARLAIKRGDVLTLPTAKGPQRVRIAGVYADYGNERGSVTLPQRWFRPWFKSDSAWRVAIMLKPKVDAETIRATLQRQHPGLSVFTQSHLRSEALRIFEQTFAVTYSLEAVGVVVAVAGLALALASLMLDRARDLATLRAVGFTSKQIAEACAWEGLGIATVGAATGLISGLWLGWLLIARVNKQSFGWTLSFALPSWQLLALGVSVIAAGLIVAALVGRWSARLKSDQEE